MMIAAWLLRFSHMDSDSSWRWEEARPLNPGAKRAGGTERVPLIFAPNFAI